MDISGSASVSAPAAVSSLPTAKVAAPTDTSAATNASPTDSVTLSNQAQEILANPSAAPNPAAANATTSATWTNDVVSQAITALNDTSGKATVADQISAYELVSGLVANTKNFDLSNPANAGAVDVATAFSTSAFVQHAQSLIAQNSSFLAASTGQSDSESVQRQLNNFDSLSSDDQQTLVAALNTANQAIHGSDLYTSVDSYIANRQAVINVDRAVSAAFANPTYAAGLTANQPSENLDATSLKFASLTKQAAATGDTATLALIALARNSGAVGDSFTTKAQAFFSQYGAAPAPTADQLQQDAAAPPSSTTFSPASAADVRARYQNLAIVSDSGNGVAITTKLSAYQALSPISTSNIAQSGISAALVSSFNNSAFSQQVSATENAYDQASFVSGGASASSAATAAINAFTSLSSDGQQIIATLYQGRGGDGTIEGYLGYLKSGLSSTGTNDTPKAPMPGLTNGSSTSQQTDSKTAFAEAAVELFAKMQGGATGKTSDTQSWIKDWIARTNNQNSAPTVSKIA